MWFEACRLDKLVDDVKNVRICSSHFQPEDYIEPNWRELGGVPRLKSTAVPRKRKAAKRVNIISHTEVSKPKEILSSSQIVELVAPLLSIEPETNMPSSSQLLNTSPSTSYRTVLSNIGKFHIHIL